MDLWKDRCRGCLKRIQNDNLDNFKYQVGLELKTSKTKRLIKHEAKKAQLTLF